MTWQNLRWPVVAAVMIVTLAALFGAGFLLKNQTVEQPLQMLYAGSPAVESYEVERMSDGYEITVKLKETPDLAAAYQDLHKQTQKIMKEVPFQLKLEDKRSPELEQAFSRINLFVQEALATGHFAEMADRVEEEAAKAGLTARFNVDESRVYVQLHDKDAFLYSVSQRTPDLKLQQQKTGGIGL